MNKDIRISTSINSNKKIRRLIRRKGEKGFHCLLSIWIDAALNRPKGVFIDYEKEDLMDAAGTNDETFIDCLVDLDLLDFDGEIYSIHNWEKHNGYAAHAEERSQKARDAANAKWGKINK